METLSPIRHSCKDCRRSLRDNRVKQTNAFAEHMFKKQLQLHLDNETKLETTRDAVANRLTQCRLEQKHLAANVQPAAKSASKHSENENFPKTVGK